MGTEPTSLEHITRGVFARRKLIGGNLYMALSEIVAHIELLEDTGDIEVWEDMRMRSKGSENYQGDDCGDVNSFSVSVQRILPLQNPGRA